MPKKEPEQVVMAPHNRRRCPCQVENYCTRPKCLDREYVVNNQGCVVDSCTVDECNKRLEVYPNTVVPVSFCNKAKCRFLRQSRSGKSYRCSRFMAEVRGRKRGAMRATKTLRMHKDKTSGWTYRKL